jgi:5-hydroxyisourate hydrolase
LSSHVLDTELGRPASGINIIVESSKGADLKNWHTLGNGVTNIDGRIKEWSAPMTLQKGVYRLTFDVKQYFEKQGRKAFFPTVQLIFEIGENTPHYHVPLLISAHGLASYRGS